MNDNYTKYFQESLFVDAKKQRKRVLFWFYFIVGVYVLTGVGLFLWYRTLPYQSPTINTVKFIHHTISAIFVIFTFVYLGIPFKRVNRFYRLTRNMCEGIKETSTGSFLEYDYTPQDKDGVDFKALIFIEWNKYKNDFFERKVLVFEQEEFPEFKEGQNVRYVTQGNVLIGYTILDNIVEEDNHDKEGEKK